MLGCFLMGRGGRGGKGGDIKRFYTMLAMLLVDNLVEATAH